MSDHSDQERRSPHEPDTLPPDIAQRARRLLFDLARPERTGYLVLVVILLLFGIGNAIGPALIAQAMDRGIPAAIDGDTTALVIPLAAFLLVTLATGVADFFGTRLTGTLAQRLMVSLRRRLFDHVQRLGIAYHERSTSGRLVSRQTSDMENIQVFLTGSLQETAIGLAAMGAIAVTLIVMDWRMAIVVFLGFIPLLWVSIVSNRAQRRNQRRTRTAIAKVIVHIVETLGGIRAVQSFRREDVNDRRIVEEDREFRNATAASLRNTAWFAAGTRLIGNLSMAAVLLVGGWLVIGDALQVGMLTAFLLYVRRFYGPLDELVQAFTMYQSASAALEKITAVIDAVPEVVEPTSPTPLPAVRAGGRRVEFDDVAFSYGDGVPVLPRFDLEIPAGQTVALVGMTGAGKSTLVKLLTRFYDPTAGRVLMDGVDLREVADDDLRRAVVMVTQESYQFGGSIADNIRIGRPGATDQQVRDAADAVGLTPFIRRMPDGFDTDVRKRGGRLSSGQRQLVSFARAFLADPDVLVLDEATAHLDIPSERQVQEALATVLEGRTAVIIAHRLSTVEIADRVLVMDDGRLVEDDTPAQLIASGGRFAKLHGAWEDSRA
ncbi:MAG: ABC transporter ATP-binding protein [Brevibacterium yomogidense]|uniref:ABC transporter ATP-binding protein n=1 Tax=Brevibacterium sp. Mu109 TaxID=1255669 RepID=UPI000C6AF547|nr:ABC transporter ATP-binding protein [Brevibacterium sp. Mu109]SMX97137.1 ATP-binding cassette, subfamily B [Brevibacterium sp. Mu109]